MASNTDADPNGRRGESLVTPILVLTIIPTALSCISVALRLYTKAYILRSTGLDDYTIAVSQVLALTVAALNILGVAKAGYGRHMEFATPEQLGVFSKVLLSVILVYNAAQIVTKISFFFQYRRLFPIPLIQKICNFGLGFLVIWGVAQQIFTPFACQPGRFIFPGFTTYCIDTIGVFSVNAVMNMVTDFVIFLLPIWPVIQLQINWKRKAYLLVVFCFGLVACIISTVRLIQLFQTYNRGDETWTIAQTAYLSTIEISIGILCASVPTLRPLIRSVAPQWLGSSSDPPQSYRLSTVDATGRSRRTAPETGIYIQKEVEFHSTTELRSATTAKDPYSFREDSADGISLEIQGGSSSEPKT
ncbi:hypothetical protein GQ44DRAFT_425487 [Phaeosphaeriaceae sp. PMI808]|nr:hypothetical protein GQ44DRAFT_425487 [Phaeosphaeriaceae sp. PMI808]